MNDLDGARALMGAAERDLRALRGMEDAVVFTDEIAGFHAQQAAEKPFKVRLILLGEPYPMTHDPDHLLRLVERGGRLAASAWSSGHEFKGRPRRTSRPSRLL